MPRRLSPVHVWSCAVDGREVSSTSCPEPCEVHNVKWLDMGWRVGEASANYAWYSTEERALTDKRTK